MNKAIKKLIYLVIILFLGSVISLVPSYNNHTVNLETIKNILPSPTDDSSSDTKTNDANIIVADIKEVEDENNATTSKSQPKNSNQLEQEKEKKVIAINQSLDKEITTYKNLNNNTNALITSSQNELKKQRQLTNQQIAEELRQQIIHHNKKTDNTNNTNVHTLKQDSDYYSKFNHDKSLDKTQNSEQGLIFCSEASINSLNPQRNPLSNMTSTLSYALYDRLLKIDPNSKQIKPAIGTFVYSTNEGLTRVYRINKNIRFQNNDIFTPTRNLNAEDVAFSFDRMLNNENPFHKNITFPYLQTHDSVDFIKKVEAIKPDLVAFTLDKKLPNFEMFLAHDNSVILSKEYADLILQKNLPIETLDYKPIGTGPFQLQTFLRDNYIRLVPFEAYHGKKPKLKTLVLRHSTHVNKRLTQLFTNECHVISNPTPGQLALMLNGGQRVNFINQGSIFGTFLVFNTKQNILKNKEARKAIAALINLADLNKSVYFNYGQYRFDNNNFKLNSLGLNRNSAENNNIQSKDNLENNNLENNTLTTNNTNSNSSSNNNDSIKNLEASNTSNNSSHLLDKNSEKNSNHTNTNLKEELQSDLTQLDTLNEQVSYNKTPIFIEQNNPESSEVKSEIEKLHDKNFEIVIFERNTLGDKSIVRTAQFIKSVLEDKGIHVNIKYLNYNSGVSKLKNHNFDLALINIYSDTMDIVDNLTSCGKRLFNYNQNIQSVFKQNFSGWCNQEYDDLVISSQNVNSEEIFNQKLFRKKEILSDEMPILPLVYFQTTFFSLKEVHDITQSSLGGIDFTNVYIGEAK